MSKLHGSFQKFCVWWQHHAALCVTELKCHVWLQRHYCCCHKGALSL